MRNFRHANDSPPIPGRIERYSTGPREETATAIDEADEAQADLVEAMEAGGPNEEAAEIQADAIRERGEETKDHLENMADEMDDTPQ